MVSLLLLLLCALSFQLQTSTAAEVATATVDSGEGFNSNGIDNRCHELIDASRDGQLDKIADGIENGVNVNCISYGQAALVEAAYSGQVTVVNRLLKAGADPNIKSYSGMNALYYAVMNGQTAVVHVLLKAGTDHTVKESVNGWTALDLAVKYGHSSIEAALRKAGALRRDDL